MKYKAIYLVLASFIGVSCGVKSFPEPPPSDVPESVKNLKIKQQGNILVLYWNYTPLYTDGRQIKSFNFQIEVNGKKEAFNIRKAGKYYWVEYPVKDKKEYCFRIFVKANKNSAVSRYKCIKPENFKKFYTDVEIVPSKEGLNFNFKGLSNDVLIYKGNSIYNINPILPIARLKITTSFTDKKVKSGRKYCYFLTQEQKKVESNRVYLKCIVYKDIYPPQPPVVSYVITKDGLTLLFSPPKEKDFAGFIIEKNGKKLINTPVKTYFFKDFTFKKGDEYKVYSVDVYKNKSKPVYLKIE